MDKLTPKNLELLKAIITVMDGTGIDFEKVAAQTGGGTKKYARDQWALLRNKIVGDVKVGDAKSSTPTKTATPSKKSATPKEGTGGNKRKIEATATGEKGSAKKRGKKDSVVASADGADGLDEDMMVNGEEGEEFNDAGAIMDDLDQI